MAQDNSSGHKSRIYAAIDLKSFYASVECMDRGLDPLTTNLVVADLSRTEKTICLAVSPSLKAHGISGRARLFEVVEQVKIANAKRRGLAPGHELTGATSDDRLLKASPELAIDYIVATPRMARYIEVSSQIYAVYLKYVAPEDIFSYSIDEVFMDITGYLNVHHMTAHELVMCMIRDVKRTTGITATAGIGSNMYLAKVAMDIVAKHIPADQDGVRIAELDEQGYRQQLWSHQPLTDFWRVGKGTVRKLEAMGIYTMGDLARFSISGGWKSGGEETLFKTFGVNAELLMDHAWGYEPCTMEAVKAYKPASNSICSGQVLQRPYAYEEARIVIREMADALSLDLAGKEQLCDQLVMDVGYDRESVEGAKEYTGPTVSDRYGRNIPKPAHGTINLSQKTASTKEIVSAAMELFNRITDRTLLIRRFTLTANHVVAEEEEEKHRADEFEQLDLFSTAEDAQRQKEDAVSREKERRLQKAILGIQQKYGKNAMLKGSSLQEGATMRERNSQIGGHRA